jgi:hypothetical protein
MPCYVMGDTMNCFYSKINGRALSLVMLAGSLALSTLAHADSLQVVKTFPGQPKILVNQGTDSGIQVGGQLNLVMKSGRKIPTRVAKANGGKSLLMIPSQYTDRIRPNTEFAFEMGAGGGDRKIASLTSSYSGVSSRSSRNAIKGMIGMANAGLSSGATVFGLDYVIPVAKNITIAPGITYWSATSGVEVGDQWSFMTIDVAGGYHVPVSQKLDVEIGGRLGLRRSSAVFPETTIQPEETFSSMGMLLTPYAGASYAMSRNAGLGAEMRLPLASSSELGMNMFYLVGFVKWQL